MMANIFRKQNQTAEIIAAAERLTLPCEYGKYEIESIKIRRDNMGGVRMLGTTLIVLTIQVIIDDEWVYVFNAEKWEGGWNVRYFDRSDWKQTLFKAAAMTAVQP